jgi:hypothetical protein
MLRNAPEAAFTTRDAPGVAGKVVRFGEIKEEAGPQARPGDIRQSGPPFQRKHARNRGCRRSYEGQRLA